MVKTKRIEIPCPVSGHGRYTKGKWVYNICRRICHLGQELVCADCEGPITVNEKWEQECKNCQS